MNCNTTYCYRHTPELIQTRNKDDFNTIKLQKVFITILRITQLTLLPLGFRTTIDWRTTLYQYHMEFIQTSLIFFSSVDPQRYPVECLYTSTFLSFHGRHTSPQCRFQSGLSKRNHCSDLSVPWCQFTMCSSSSQPSLETHCGWWHTLAPSLWAAH